jgi:hypothetical protein
MSTAGQRLRDEAIERVLRNERSEWKAGVGAILDRLIQSGKEFSGNHIRKQAKEQGIGEPHAPGCWGGMMRVAAQQGRIRKTGSVEPETPSSHARPIFVWIKAEETTEGWLA